MNNAYLLKNGDYKSLNCIRYVNGAVPFHSLITVLKSPRVGFPLTSPDQQYTRPTWIKDHKIYVWKIAVSIKVIPTVSSTHNNLWSPYLFFQSARPSSTSLTTNRTRPSSPLSSLTMSPSHPYPQPHHNQTQPPSLSRSHPHSFSLPGTLTHSYNHIIQWRVGNCIKTRSPEMELFIAWEACDPNTSTPTTTTNLYHHHSLQQLHHLCS